VEREYREELILNVNVFVVSVWRRAIWRGNDTECYCVCRKGLVERDYREELILNVTVFVVSF
jgi:hypothetical protein